MDRAASPRAARNASDPPPLAWYPSASRGPRRSWTQARRSATALDRAAKAGNILLSSLSLVALVHRQVAMHPQNRVILAPFARPFYLGARNERNILRANPVGGALRKALHRHLGITQGERWLSTLEAVAFGRGERGSRLIAPRGIDDSKLIPGKGIFVVERDCGFQHLFGFGIVRCILGRDEGMTQRPGNERRRTRVGDRLAQRRDRVFRMPRFEQNLALEFEEIWVLGISLE